MSRTSWPQASTGVWGRAVGSSSHVESFDALDSHLPLAFALTLAFMYPGPSRPGSSPWAPATPVQALVERACDPSHPEPAYTLNLELADYVNDKKANTPRDAAVEIVKLINHRNPHVAVLALHLLDTLVKNCGYPFQLQIATKEFLNELVRKFPERPPVFPGVVMTKTLELIHEWKNTICVTSKWKEDLVHIRDMHRLLSYKGYRFRDFDRSTLAASSADNLKSPQELEEEDRQAKSAKLQELIRRGTPRDLVAAQELMKDLSGSQPDKEPDYHAQTAKELDKVQQKAILLNDMLNSAGEDERIGVDGDSYQQVAIICRQARPKIQKWISEVTEEEPDSMDRLLLINDLINGVIDRYEAARKGDWSQGRQVNANNFTAPPPPEPSLISFDAFADSPPPSNAALPPSVDGSTQQQQHEPASFGGLPLDLFSSVSVASPAAAGSSSTSGQQQPPRALGDLSSLYAQPYRNPYQQQQPFPLTGTDSGFTGGGSISLSTPGNPGSSWGQPQQPQQQQQGANSTAAAKAKDPFEGLLF